MTEYRRYPKVRVELNHGKGKSVVTGPVTITFNGDDTAVVDTEGAHINDDNPAVNFRGERLLIHLRLMRNAEGNWQGQPGSLQSVTRANWTDAPPSFVGAVFAAVAAKVTEVWTEDIAREAAYVGAGNQAHSLEGDLVKLEAQVREVRTALAEAYKIMRDNDSKKESGS
jgi:hypothetical protein